MVLDHSRRSAQLLQALGSLPRESALLILTCESRAMIPQSHALLSWSCCAEVSTDIQPTVPSCTRRWGICLSTAEKLCSFVSSSQAPGPLFSMKLESRRHKEGREWSSCSCRAGARALVELGLLPRLGLGSLRALGCPSAVTVGKSIRVRLEPQEFLTQEEGTSTLL